MFWYRIELDPSGKLIKSEQVADAGERDGAPRVYYLKAVTLSCAEGMAFREYHRTRQQARREAYRKLKRCKCGRSRDRETRAESEFATCPKCRELGRQDHLRDKARLRGLPVAPVNKAERFVDRRNEEKRILLEEVREQFLRLNVRPFGEWLNAQIAALEPKAPPQLRVVGARKS